jgi:hypothetical protein
LVAHWERFAASAPPPDPVIDAPWAALEAAWDDDGAHTKFLDAAVAADALDVAAAHYRRRCDGNPDDARAKTGLTRTLLMAQRIYEARAQSERTPPPSLKTLKLAGALFAGLMFGAVIYIFMKMMSHTPR